MSNASCAILNERACYEKQIYFYFKNAQFKRYLLKKICENLASSNPKNTESNSLKKKHGILNLTHNLEENFNKNVFKYPRETENIRYEKCV